MSDSAPAFDALRWFENARGATMATRKKQANETRQKKHKAAVPLPPGGINIEAMLMIGEERVIIDHDENDNVNFMAEIIDAM
jgi:hemin uptake protein HemP